MKVISILIRLSLHFSFFMCMIVSSDHLTSLYPTRSVRAYTADVATKKEVDHIEELVRTSVPQGELVSLLGKSGEFLTSEIGHFPFEETPWADCWGSPIVICVAPKSELHRIEIGVYSKGPDGISVTRGNDADDISSWNSVDNAYWKTVHLEAFHNLWSFRVKLSAGLAVMSYMAATFYSRLRRKRAS